MVVCGVCVLGGAAKHDGFPVRGLGSRKQGGVPGVSGLEFCQLCSESWALSLEDRGCARDKLTVSLTSVLTALLAMFLRDRRNCFSHALPFHFPHVLFWLPTSAPASCCHQIKHTPLGARRRDNFLRAKIYASGSGSTKPAKVSNFEMKVVFPVSHYLTG